MKEIIKVPNRIAQEADDLAKETRLSFGDCLDILMQAYLSTTEKQPQHRIIRMQPKQQKILVGIAG